MITSFFFKFIDHLDHGITTIQDNVTILLNVNINMLSFTPITDLTSTQSPRQNNELTFVDIGSFLFTSYLIISLIEERLPHQRVFSLFFRQGPHVRFGNIVSRVSIKKKQVVLVILDGQHLSHVSMVAFIVFGMNNFVHLHNKTNNQP